MQGFPESYIFPNFPDRASYKQAGNTVCVPVVRQIAAAIYIAISVSANDKDGVTLVGIVRNSAQLKICKSNMFYHMPVRKLNGKPEEIIYIALLAPGSGFMSATGISCYGKVKSVKAVKRYEISELPKRSEEQYYRFEISEWVDFPERVPIELKGYFKTCMLSDIVHESV